MNRRTKKTARFLLFAFLCVLGSWVSTQWFARSMLFSSALDASFVNVGELKVYSPHQIFVWLTAHGTSQFGVLLGDMLPLFVCLALGFWMLWRTSTTTPALTTSESAAEIRHATLSASHSYVNQVREHRSAEALENIEGTVDHPSNVLLASIESAFFDDDSNVFFDEYESQTAKTSRSGVFILAESEKPIEILEGEYVEVNPFEDFKSVRTNFNSLEQIKNEAEMGSDNPFDGNETIINLFPDDDEEDFVAGVYSNTEGFLQSKTVRAAESDIVTMLEDEMFDAKTTRLDSGDRLTKNEALAALAWRPAEPEEIVKNLGRFIKIDPEFPSGATISNLDPNTNTTVKVSKDDVEKMLGDEVSLAEVPIPTSISESKQRQTAIIYPSWQQPKSEDVVISLDKFIEVEEPDFPNSTVSVSKDLQNYLKETSTVELVDG